MCAGHHISQVYQHFRAGVDSFMEAKARRLWKSDLLAGKSILSLNVPENVDFDGRDLDGSILIVARNGRRQINNR